MRDGRRDLVPVFPGDRRPTAAVIRFEVGRVKLAVASLWVATSFCIRRPRACVLTRVARHAGGCLPESARSFQGLFPMPEAQGLPRSSPAAVFVVRFCSGDRARRCHAPPTLASLPTRGALHSPSGATSFPKAMLARSARARSRGCRDRTCAVHCVTPFILVSASSMLCIGRLRRPSLCVTSRIFSAILRPCCKTLSCSS